MAQDIDRIEEIQEEEQKESKLLRISLALSNDHTQNIFNYAKIRDMHLSQLEDKVSTVQVIESDYEEEGEQVRSLREKKKPGRKIDPELEYDLDDDFIDDSDLYLADGLEAPSSWDFGFFVYRGPLDSFIQNPTPKIKKKRFTSTAVAVDGVPKTKPAKKLPVTPKPKPKKDKIEVKKTEKTELALLPGPVLLKLDALRSAAEKESFEVKKIFPPDLKPLVNEAAIAAMDCNALNDSFFKHLTNILPYNTFTLRKLISRLTYPDRLAQLQGQIPKLYQEFEIQVKHEVEQCEQSKFKWNNVLKILFWNILCIEWEMAWIDNDINVLNKQPPQFTEPNVRKAVYQKMLSYWPAEMMDSTSLSMQYSLLKKKREKDAMKEGNVPITQCGHVVRVDPFSPSVPRKRESMNSIEADSAKKTKLNNIYARKQELDEFMDVPLQMASPPSTSAVLPTFPDDSPHLAHPYQRPTTNYVTLEHWLYQLQKNAWLLKEKLTRYILNPISLLNIFLRRRKLIEYGFQIRNAWVYLMLYLGMAIAEQQKKLQVQTSNKIQKLAVATGQTDFDSLEVDDAHKIYLQGEKYFVGFGVAQCYDTAYKRYQVAAKMGLPEAMTMLGTILEFGLGKQKDLVQAINWYEKAAALKHAEANCILGRLHEHGKGVERNYKNAFDNYKIAASAGNREGLTHFAHMLEHGIGCKVDLSQAIDQYKIAVERGSARAQTALGVCYYSGKGVKRDLFEAVLLFRKAAAQSYAPGHYNLGVCYEQGHGVTKDLVEAKVHYKRAVEQKHANATCALACILMNEGQHLEAIKLFHLAISLGNIDAYYHLGTCYEAGLEDSIGLVLSQDFHQALRYYNEAARAGHIQALIRVASILFCGPIELRDLDTAIKCLEKASEPSIEYPKGNSEAQNMLGELFEIGEFTTDNEPDVQKALNYYKLAKSQGHPRAIYNLASLLERGMGCVKDQEKAIRLYKELAAARDFKDAKIRIAQIEAAGIE